MRREYWRLIKQGVVPPKAALQVGLSDGCGTQWFREAGGVTPVSLTEPSGRYLNLAEREEIAVLHAQKVNCRVIALCWDARRRRLAGRSPATAPLVTVRVSTEAGWLS